MQALELMLKEKEHFELVAQLKLSLKKSNMFNHTIVSLCTGSILPMFLKIFALRKNI